ncbi:hypothetical protein DL546_003032 [Coniochaeta pulveracea]|uniref:DUF4604 domain-containing protein n=1 Tax=Coniochaeta pulveracea TaxID=177199 RepID=A0A420Y8H8_9PEZI|nr:hypothetical protein DL546_003032 [Coniochaeta pulveracea]
MSQKISAKNLQRHAKPRSASEEAEDGPLILDEEGNAVSGLRIGVDGAVTEAARENTAQKEGDEDIGKEAELKGEEQLKHKEKTAGIGATKKRKAVKVVGGEEAEEDHQKGKSEKPKPREKKAKSKKVKLSFGDEEG